MKLARPLLRYHGGKWRLAPWIIANMPKHRFYVEPYGGGGSVLLRKPRSYGEVYNDIDGDVVNVFRVVRDPESAKELQRQLELTPFAREEFNLAYEEITEPIEAARRTLIKSFMGFSADAMFRHVSSSSGMRVVASRWKAPTGMRTHVKRTGTTPASDWARWPSMIHLFTDRLRSVVIENRDATAVMLQYDDGQALHYVDPPYVHSTRRSRHGYRNEMTDEDHRCLAAVLGNLKGAVLLSAYPSPLYRELYEGWTLIERDSLAQKSLKTVECLWFNKSAFNALPQPLLHQGEVTA